MEAIMNNDTAPSLLDLNEDGIMILFGVLYFCISLPVMVLLVIVMKALHIKDRKSENVTYKLMNFANSFEISQAFFHFLSSCLPIFPEINNRYDVIVRILGCIMNTFWIGELPVMAMLAVCRILIFLEYMRADRMVSGLKIVIASILSWMLFVIIAGCITQNFKFTIAYWEYDLTQPYAGMFVKLELLTSFVSLAIAYMSYMTIIFLIYRKRQVTASFNNKNEICIMLQYTFTITYIVIYIIMWHHGRDWFHFDSPISSALVNAYWIASYYISPTMLLILNGSIRQECKILLGMRVTKKVSSMWVVTMT